eukprot:3895672-Prymnesium_polylepis.2
MSDVGHLEPPRTVPAGGPPAAPTHRGESPLGAPNRQAAEQPLACNHLEQLKLVRTRSVRWTHLKLQPVFKRDVGRLHQVGSGLAWLKNTVVLWLWPGAVDSNLARYERGIRPATRSPAPPSPAIRLRGQAKGWSAQHASCVDSGKAAPPLHAPVYVGDRIGQPVGTAQMRNGEGREPPKSDREENAARSLGCDPAWLILSILVQPPIPAEHTRLKRG